MEDKSLSSLFSGKEPLGFILLACDTLCPFGLLPAETEADALGDSRNWKEVKVLPPTWMWGLQPGKSPLTCPLDFCGEKVGKNHSFESHLKKHLSLITSDKNNCSTLSQSVHLPLGTPIKYYCNVPNCIYGFAISSSPRNFSKLKYLKQHYFKVHAPKTLKCLSCEKTFSTLGFLEIHKRMCGNSFDCSACSSKYSTLEALQTHCRRKLHHYDYNKYREIFNISKQEAQARKSEEILKQKLAAVSIASNPDPIYRTELHQLPIRIPRPKTITTCGPGGATSHVTWTYENGTENLKVKVEISTQTSSDSESQKVHETDQSEKSKLLSTGSQHGKRKKSAETQTGKVRYKISTETQTANVVKRRRASKKQNVEAETQCTLLDPFWPPPVSGYESDIDDPEKIESETADDFNMDTAVPDPSTGPTVVPPFASSSMISLVGVDDDSSYGTEAMIPDYSEDSGLHLEAMVSRMNTNPVLTSEMCVGNRFDEVAQQLFDFEEFNRETQTDPNLFHPSDYTLSDFEMEIGGEMDPLSNLLNLVTTETQTWPGVSPPRTTCVEGASSSSTISTFKTAELQVQSEDWNAVTPLTRRLSQTEYSSPFDIPLLSPRDGNANSPTFLETMDNETQTQTSEFVDGFDIDMLLNILADQQ